MLNCQTTGDNKAVKLIAPHRAVTPPLNRAQVDKLKNISMGFFMNDQTDVEYLKIKTFPIPPCPHLQPIFVTNGVNSKTKIYEEFCIKKSLKLST